MKNGWPKFIAKAIAEIILKISLRKLYQKFFAVQKFAFVLHIIIFCTSAFSFYSCEEEIQLPFHHCEILLKLNLFWQNCSRTLNICSSIRIMSFQDSYLEIS